MMHTNIGLIAFANGPSYEALSFVASALDKQVNRDVAPAWKLNVSVHAYPTLKHAPAGTWPVYIQPTLDTADAEGFHLDANKQPYARVLFQQAWSVTASHEVIEMSIDPWGNRLERMSLDLFRVGGNYKSEVLALVEACDPCENFTYKVDGIDVSDFALPDYYSGTSQRGTFLNSVGAGQIGANGYLSFIEISSNVWKQATRFTAAPGVEITTLGPAANSAAHRTNCDRQARALRKQCAIGLRNPFASSHQE